MASTLITPNSCEHTFSRKFIGLLSVCLLLSSCSTTYQSLPDQPLVKKEKPTESTALPPADAPKGTLTVTETPKAPAPERISTAKPTLPAPTETASEANITLSFDQVELPTLIQLIYGNILKQNFSVDPAIANRKDLVTLRTANPQTPTQVAEIVRLLLKSYGIAVMDIGGLYRIVPDNNMQGYLPEIRRGRALPETPLPLRPIFQLVELQNVKSNSVKPMLQAMFGDKVKINEDALKQFLLLSGTTDDVNAALEAIQVLDQPSLKSRISTRLNPVFWSADELAKKLNELLNAEGYATIAMPTPDYSVGIHIIPVAPINAVIVLAQDQATLDHVVQWAKELDKPLENRSGGGGFFTYQALNTDASALAKTLQDLLAGTAQVAPAAAQGQPSKKPTRVVVNPATNTLILQGSSDEYTQLISLLREIDRPAKSALIEVTIAEITLSDNLEFGINWSGGYSLDSGKRVTGAFTSNRTQSGLKSQRPDGTPADIGFITKIPAGVSNPDLTLRALATENRLKVLSTPRIMARNGDQSTIQIGNDVPIIVNELSSSAASATPASGSGSGSSGSTNTSPNVNRTFQYRPTGIILKVKPIIYSGNRVDVLVNQEISNAVKTDTGASDTPTITTRKVETNLPLVDGETVVLGGLIETKKNKIGSGIPFLKDIPGLGWLFSDRSNEDSRTELVILITPYIISDAQDAKAITEALRQQLHFDEPNAAGRSLKK